MSDVSVKSRRGMIMYHWINNVLIYLLICIYIFKDLRERVGGEGQRERVREPQADSMLSTEPGVELDLMTPRSDLIQNHESDT